MGIWTNIALWKSAAKMDYLVKTRSGDPLLTLFFKPTEKLMKHVKAALHLNPMVRLSWKETWWYLICRTRMQCIIWGVPLDHEELTNKAIGVLGSCGELNISLYNRWDLYSSNDAIPEGRILTPEDGPREKLLANARQYVHFVLTECAKTSTEGLAAGFNNEYLSAAQREQLEALTKSIEERVTESVILSIATATEKAAVKIRKQIAKL